MWHHLKEVYLLTHLHFQYLLGDKLSDVFSAPFLEWGPNVVQLKLKYQAYVESYAVEWKTCCPIETVKNQPFMLPPFAVTTMDPQKSSSEATILCNTIIYVARVWCYALFLSNLGGFSEASWILSSTGVFGGERPFHMWWLSLMVYLFMAPIQFFSLIFLHISWSTGFPDSIYSLIFLMNKQNPMWNLLTVFGAPLLFPVPLFLSCQFFSSDFCQVTLHRNFNRHLQIKIDTIPFESYYLWLSLIFSDWN